MDYVHGGREKSPINLKFSIGYFYGVKKWKKENVVPRSGLLTSYLSCKLCTILTESFYVVRDIKVVNLTTKVIQIKPYTISISQRFGIEVETSGFRGEDV